MDEARRGYLIERIFNIGLSRGYSKEVLRKAIEAHYQRALKRFDLEMLTSAVYYVETWRPLEQCSLDDLVLWRDRAIERCSRRPAAAVKYMDKCRVGKLPVSDLAPSVLNKEQRHDAKWIRKLNVLISKKLFHSREDVCGELRVLLWSKADIQPIPGFVLEERKGRGGFFIPSALQEHTLDMFKRTRQSMVSDSTQKAYWVEENDAKN